MPKQQRLQVAADQEQDSGGQENPRESRQSEQGCGARRSRGEAHTHRQCEGRKLLQLHITLLYVATCGENGHHHNRLHRLGFRLLPGTHLDND